MESMNNQALDTEPTAPDMDALWEETEVEAAPGTDQPGEEPVGSAPAEGQDGPQQGTDGQQGQTSQPPQSEERYTLKHMDETRTVDRSEVIRLAQQGLDYARIREERDQLRQFRTDAGASVDLVKRMAALSNMEVPAYIEHCLVEAKKAQGLNEETAKAQVALEKREAILQARDREAAAALQAKQAIADRAKERQAAQQRDMESFLNAYPDVKAETIPGEVWQKVKAGESLLVAYTMHQNQQLKAQAAARAQNEQNAARTPGSMVTQGQKMGRTIDDYWDDAGG